VTGICTVIKKLFEAYVNSGHDVTNVTQVFAALLSAGGIRNIKPSVIELLPGYLDKIVLCIGISKLIPGVSKEKNIIFCPEEECTLTFDNFDGRNQHIIDGQQSEDRIKTYFISKLKTGYVQPSQKNVLIDNGNEEVKSAKYIEGWALKLQKPQPKLGLKQKNLFTGLF
jgi:hypothetical protein